ncbi:MAG: hypothetical protein HYW06_01030 [Gemmatimonadetes bacterium]|nr:hypothetical protein [Gemmatimonadota bacterium]
MQPVGGHDGGRAVQLGLSEHERQHRDEQILARDADDLAAGLREMPQQGSEQKGGVVLAAFGGVVRTEIEAKVNPPDRVRQGRGQAFDHLIGPRRGVAVEEGDEHRRAHGYRLRPYRLILW